MPLPYCDTLKDETAPDSRAAKNIAEIQQKIFLDVMEILYYAD
jgi:hypothetical protein